jgi:hypothetical protein
MGQWPDDFSWFRREMCQRDNNAITRTRNQGDGQQKLDCIGYHKGFLRYQTMFSPISRLCQTLALPLLVNRLNGFNNMKLQSYLAYLDVKEKPRN